jgi:type IV pilus assembly protein PilB
VRAAVAGRLVLSRLAVSSPVAALERLLELGAERGPLTATLSCVVAQRVVQRICADCREPYYAGGSDLSELGRSPEEAGRRLLARGSGCVACAGTGFRGRIAIFEVLSVTDEIRTLFANGASAADIERAAVSAGMKTFRDQCVSLCLEGVTTVSELRRISAHEPEPGATTIPDSDPGDDED